MELIPLMHLMQQRQLQRLLSAIWVENGKQGIQANNAMHKKCKRQSIKNLGVTGTNLSWIYHGILEFIMKYCIVPGVFSINQLIHRIVETCCVIKIIVYFTPGIWDSNLFSTFSPHFAFLSLWVFVIYMPLMTLESFNFVYTLSYLI